MAVFALLVLAVLAIVVFAKIRNAEKRRSFEDSAAANPLHPTIAATLREKTSDDWTARRDANGAARARTADILDVLARRREALLLVVHSRHAAFHGLLVVTQGRTLLYDGRLTNEIEHRGASTAILASRDDDPYPFVEISRGGNIIRFAASGFDEARLICGVIDLWAESPEVAPDPRVRIGPNGVEIDDAFFADTLRRAGHAVTPFNLRSIHERFGMFLHGRALQYVEARYGEPARQRFIAAAGRPADDRDLPGWPVRVLREWSSFDAGIAPVSAITPLLVQDTLLDPARNGGYLAHPERPLSMWRSDQYDEGGRRRAMPA